MELRNVNKIVLASALITVTVGVGLARLPAFRLSTNPTGDARISEALRAGARTGHHHLAAFVLVDGDVCFGGLGADETSEFEIGSITKVFNGELLDQAVERDELTYSTTVAEILGERAEGSMLADVTLLELATHTSGLPRLGKQKPRNILAALIGRNPDVGQTRDFVIDSALSARLKDRGKENYSNLGHAFLGQLLAESAGVSYAELIQRDIFTPLGMTDSYVALPGTVGPDAPRGVGGFGLPVQPWESDGPAPAGAIRSTPRDMVKFAQAIVDKQTPNPVWALNDDYFWHNGSTFGFADELRIYPERRAAIYAAGDTCAEINTVIEALQQSVWHE
ncbi:serine hydrolase domain-containing protein [Corynebacterium cystitidis]|uniref:serine hydrolase domain-containing protein n=1 Tax=Corynebacterium cystitidis TaxID=35757 RepID=UPI00211E0603|nr:serine hydrolase domain-containing protein [Corynebacterium cystitidis]